jgi:hypothetical protein
VLTAAAHCNDLSAPLQIAFGLAAVGWGWLVFRWRHRSISLLVRFRWVATAVLSWAIGGLITVVGIVQLFQGC